MSKSKKHQKKFSLEGKVQEVTIKDDYKLKYVHVQTTAGNSYVVKVAKRLRRNFSSVLKPGLGVKMTGEMTVCQKTGEEGLKAFNIIPDFSNNSTTPCQNHTVELIGNSSSPLIELKLPETEHICSKSQKVTGGNAKCAGKKAQILVCQKSDCQKRGAGKVCQALSEALIDRGLQDQVTIKKTGCLKKCKAGPNMVIMPNKAKYSRISSAEIPEVIEKHFALEA
ncbi:MAG: (2Fe-2S) ferredoxin domain-containing protein [Okeania sp. SIO2F4]|uniref:(2Fe-2S) ferredoxin domain-containing protein n=1 Tax=Okeania sp. SIO2F4 TaxID=2607790 RepID=UPI00142C5BED|nr:(2Fe-2S) ferredoxin domain-containing protein [Okeania sp. SIO2F4]NES06924.1 (2Fe-2S) ferredoxin domain-containing protein [Okeania sp. SIO2F4]